MGIHYMCNPRIHGPYVNPIQNIRGYLTTPQVYLTQHGDINDSHPGYTLEVELDISIVRQYAHVCVGSRSYNLSPEYSMILSTTTLVLS